MSAIAFDRFLGNGQTESRSRFAGCSRAKEAIEDLLARSRRHTWAGIDDVQERRLRMGADDQLNCAAGWGELDRIVDQVDHGLTDTLPIGDRLNGYRAVDDE